MKNLIIIILLVLNFYLMYANVKLEISNESRVPNGEMSYQENNNLLISRVKNKKLLNRELNLLAIWSEEGCSICKTKLYQKFSFYKNEFSDIFKFLYIGNPELDIQKYDINEEQIILFKTTKEVFADQIVIDNPIILLADKNGNIIMSYKMLPLDVNGFEKFNLKITYLLNLI